MSDYLFCSNEELVEAMSKCGDVADREEAHETADDILVVALLRAANDDFPLGLAQALVSHYHEVDKWYA